MFCGEKLAERQASLLFVSVFAVFMVGSVSQKVGEVGVDVGLTALAGVTIAQHVIYLIDSYFDKQPVDWKWTVSSLAFSTVIGVVSINRLRQSF
jgi:uncharacterized membrane protein HdeD (DUF308 family)